MLFNDDQNVKCDTTEGYYNLEIELNDQNKTLIQ